MTSTELAPPTEIFIAKKAMFAFMGAAFRIYGLEGNLRYFVKQKAFKLKEEITAFSDEAQTDPMLGIQARGIGDFMGTYDVTDKKTGEALGALKREGLKSMLRDEWTLFDTSGAEIGKLKEDGSALALLRRFFPIIPQGFTMTLGGETVGIIKQKFNPFQLVYTVDFTQGRGKLDPRIGIAAVVLLLAIEGRQQ